MVGSLGLPPAAAAAAADAVAVTTQLAVRAFAF